MELAYLICFNIQLCKRTEPWHILYRQTIRRGSVRLSGRISKWKTNKCFTYPPRRISITCFYIQLIPDQRARPNKAAAECCQTKQVAWF